MARRGNKALLKQYADKALRKVEGAYNSTRCGVSPRGPHNVSCLSMTKMPAPCKCGYNKITGYYGCICPKGAIRRARKTERDARGVRAKRR